MLGTRRRAGFAAIVALLVLASSIAGAKDYCVTIDPVHSDVLIGLGFTIPSKGKCKHWNGLGTYGGVVNAHSAGTGCTSSDGSHFSLTVQSIFFESGGETFIDSVSFALPMQNGSDTESTLNNSGPTLFHAAGAACSKNSALAVSAGRDKPTMARTGSKTQ